ncbi:MAG: M23 family metallopeptidase [Edaphocola sp.]
MTKNKLLTTAICGALWCNMASAQKNYPKDYFRSPLDLPLLLAGNFGECRPNHFHTGLDFKTNEKENQNVYAAADGYVSRISISHSGYGNAIYITHPNGYATLYGHLNDFYPVLQKYVVDEQYRRKQWNIDVNLPEGKFAVKKGQFIAYSGTTGGSTGPHLHFEVRDTKTEHVLNGGLFGFAVKDHKPPVPKSIAVYTQGSIYLQQPQIVALKKVAGGYTTIGNVSVKDATVRIAVKADDYMEGSPNSLGVYEMKLFLDDKLQAAWRLDDIDFDQNRYVNAFADFRLKEDNKGWYQTLFKTPGNIFENYYFLNKNDGALDIQDGLAHAVHIELYDVWGNKTDLNFHITGTAAAPTPNKNCTQWQPGNNIRYASANVRFDSDDKAVYDMVCADVKEEYTAGKLSSVVQLQDTRIPLQSGSKLAIKLNRLLPLDLTEKLVFVHHVRATKLPGNNPQDAAAATYENGWAVAQVRTFGNYYAAMDTTAPVIASLQKGNNLSAATSMKFTVKDNLTSVAKFTATLDGKWLRFVRSGNVYTYAFDEHCPPGPHRLLLTAEDENGNTRELNYNFTR